MLVEQTTLDIGPASDPAALRIPGLRYHPSFLDEAHQRSAIERIDSEPWLTDLQRRVQHYGWRYDYSARMVSRDMRIGPLPEWLEEIACTLDRQFSEFDTVPNQAIINEYEPGQGIAMHVDRHCFGSAVATVSLGDDWTMDFQLAGKSGPKESMLLPRGSVLVLSGDARYRWRHGIAKRGFDRDPRSGQKRARKRRLSLTFRTVRLDDAG